MLIQLTNLAEKLVQQKKRGLFYTELMIWTHPGFVCLGKLEISFHSGRGLCYFSSPILAHLLHDSLLDFSPTLVGNL